MTGPELRALRRRHKLTGTELGDMLKVSANTVYRWERGEVVITPRAEAHIRLALVEPWNFRLTRRTQSDMVRENTGGAT